MNSYSPGAFLDVVAGQLCRGATYSGFWNRDYHPTLIPTTGCSVPTFHGSSSDAMAIAATAVTQAAGALAKRINSGYLWASPTRGSTCPS